ncbi:MULTISPECIES: hypothetical protein [Pyrobaculum]|jgi:hypothetical protein|uniref:Uncharacterized protein n=2 Tax=Pyrobaculum aerophilum TaxID=13773 RepID=Q8ZZ80_PYRAE|nr:MULTISPECIES: hypothetical protein [Pyrobaculum]AAL62761.1 hypothetical protein PAE0394 [Pyrobaculum aerophilum str. IM2]MCX8136380.1 hypothetical protein [Pyrobaculum aerophilum]HII46884.1 hypothetical protein [Pyrobaculum aerophilum]
MIVKNVYDNIATNAVETGQRIYIISTAAAYYDTSVEVISVRIRNGEPKYVVEGSGNFVIFADDDGIWAVDLEVKRWRGDYKKVVEALRKARVEVW